MRYEKIAVKHDFKKNYTKCNNCIDVHASVLLRYTLEHKYLITDIVTLVSELFTFS